MLIRFSVENFLSFKERQVFSMLPGKGTLKRFHKTEKVNGVSVLKTGVLFGANASGKSNLVKAIAFGRHFVLQGTKADELIKYQPYRLDAHTRTQDSRIEFELQHRGKNYAYGFVFNPHRIVEEWLYEINAKEDRKIFDRDAHQAFDLTYLLAQNRDAEAKQFLNFTAKGTRDNQLFLTEIKSRKVEEYVKGIDDLLHVIDWFQNALKVISPDTRYNEGIKSEIKSNDELKADFESLLAYFDTGIQGICLEPVQPEKVSDIPSLLIEDLKSDLLKKNSQNFRGMLSSKNATYFLSKTGDGKEESDIQIQKFMTLHPVAGQPEPEKFDTRDESDGTNRIIDFIPLLLDLFEGGNVFVIDEMERSLHPNLIYDLVDLFLESSKGIDGQMIFTSHESSLLTQKLLRKDEIWFAVKEQGQSRLYSLEEYNVRFDKELRRDYLLGRYKAIPKLGDRNRLPILKRLEKDA